MELKDFLKTINLKLLISFILLIIFIGVPAKDFNYCTGDNNCIVLENNIGEIGKDFCKPGLVPYNKSEDLFCLSSNNICEIVNCLDYGNTDISLESYSYTRDENYDILLDIVGSSTNYDYYYIEGQTLKNPTPISFPLVSRGTKMLLPGDIKIIVVYFINYSGVITDEFEVVLGKDECEFSNDCLPDEYCQETKCVTESKPEYEYQTSVLGFSTGFGLKYDLKCKDTLCQAINIALDYKLSCGINQCGITSSESNLIFEEFVKNFILGLSADRLLRSDGTLVDLKNLSGSNDVKDPSDTLEENEDDDTTKRNYDIVLSDSDISVGVTGNVTPSPTPSPTPDPNEYHTELIFDDPKVENGKIYLLYASSEEIPPESSILFTKGKKLSDGKGLIEEEFEVINNEVFNSVTPNEYWKIYKKEGFGFILKGDWYYWIQEIEYKDINCGLFLSNSEIEAEIVNENQKVFKMSHKNYDFDLSIDYEDQYSRHEKFYNKDPRKFYKKPSFLDDFSVKLKIKPECDFSSLTSEVDILPEGEKSELIKPYKFDRETFEQDQSKVSRFKLIEGQNNNKYKTLIENKYYNYSMYFKKDYEKTEDPYGVKNMNIDYFSKNHLEKDIFYKFYKENTNENFGDKNEFEPSINILIDREDSLDRKYYTYSSNKQYSTKKFEGTKLSLCHIIDGSKNLINPQVLNFRTNVKQFESGEFDGSFINTNRSKGDYAFALPFYTHLYLSINKENSYKFIKEKFISNLNITYDLLSYKISTPLDTNLRKSNSKIYSRCGLNKKKKYPVILLDRADSVTAGGAIAYNMLQDNTIVINNTSNSQTLYHEIGHTYYLSDEYEHFDKKNMISSLHKYYKLPNNDFFNNFLINRFKGDSNCQHRYKETNYSIDNSLKFPDVNEGCYYVEDSFKYSTGSLMNNSDHLDESWYFNLPSCMVLLKNLDKKKDDDKFSFIKSNSYYKKICCSYKDNGVLVNSGDCS